METRLILQATNPHYSSLSGSYVWSLSTKIIWVNLQLVMIKEHFPSIKINQNPYIIKVDGILSKIISNFFSFYRPSVTASKHWTWLFFSVAVQYNQPFFSLNLLPNFCCCLAELAAEGRKSSVKMAKVIFTKKKNFGKLN